MEIYFTQRRGYTTFFVSILVFFRPLVITSLKAELFSILKQRRCFFPRQHFFVPVVSSLASLVGFKSAPEPAIDYQFEATNPSVPDEAAAYARSRSLLIPQPLPIPLLER
jgi:hypothetical protein